MIARVILVAAALAAWLVTVPAGWIERFYSRGVYAALQPAVTGLSNRVPFALFDVLVAGGITVAVVATAQALARAWRARSIGRAVRYALTVLAAISAVYLVFLAAWGLNYRRQPLADHLAFSPTDANHDRLLVLARDVVAQMNQIRGEAHRQGFPAWDQLRAALEPAFLSVNRQLEPAARPRPGVPKWSLLSYYFERAGVSGMTDPFFLEVLVDRGLLPFERPFVLAHEWAHLAGRADEAEANFLGWLVCVHSGPAAAYSGWLYLYAEAMAALPPQERAPLARALAAGPRADLAAVAERARRIQPRLRDASWRVYDRYLRANRVQEGVASYDRALQLVLGTRFKEGWTPVLREAASGR